MNENDIIVSRIGNEIVGYCCVSIYANGTILWIREIAVTPSHHRKGFGQKLRKARSQTAFISGGK
jgi:GNAT superfamily N-acetyltransferase